MKKFVIASLLIAGTLQAEANKSVESLSAETRGLLSQEMLHIEQGMRDIFSHIVRGEYEEVNTIALNIRNSFIMRKKLTQAQKQEIRQLPKSFLELDHSFHETAGELANAAEFGDKDAVMEAYQKMASKCVQCHSTYATHRFSNFED